MIAQHAALETISVAESARRSRIRFDVDAMDEKIMAELQRNARVRNVQLAKNVGLSPAPVCRRVQALECSSAIKGYHAQLDNKKLGFEISAFVGIGLKSQNSVALTAFKHTIKQWPDVREIYAVQGETDFLLKCVARNFPEFQDFIETRLMTLPNVRKVHTMLILQFENKLTFPIP